MGRGFEPLYSDHIDEAAEKPLAKMDTKDKAELIRAILEEKKADDVKIIDVRGKSSITDVLVIASASSSPHLRALANDVERGLREKAGEHARRSGDEESAWIVLDLFDVMVHVFLPEARSYYRLEELWG